MLWPGLYFKKITLAAVLRLNYKGTKVEGSREEMLVA